MALSNDWVLQHRGRPVELKAHETTLAKVLVQQAYDNAKATNTPVGLSLAAAYDLFVAAEYYKRVTNKGWLYYAVGEPLLLLPYTNTCPRCMLSGRFHHHKGQKPGSGQIGQATARMLGVFYDQLFARFDRPLHIFNGVEPVDFIVIDDATNTALLAEIKAAPVLTLPLAVNTTEQRKSDAEGETVSVGEHDTTDYSTLYSAPIYCFLPRRKGETWTYELVSLGTPKANDETWAYTGLALAFGADDALFSRYFDFWQRALTAYGKPEGSPHAPVFWLTNGCGQPSPRPLDWLKRKEGSGYESISDAKTSAGMDRTDDIKKGIYQVLKIGAESRKAGTRYTVKTGLLSNVHAVRHGDQYLTPLDSIVWAFDEEGAAKTAGDLPPDTALYGLTDGIITFTESTMRDDEWIKRNFTFDA